MERSAAAVAARAPVHPGNGHRGRCHSDQPEEIASPGGLERALTRHPIIGFYLADAAGAVVDEEPLLSQQGVPPRVGEGVIAGKARVFCGGPDADVEEAGLVERRAAGAKVDPLDARVRDVVDGGAGEKRATVALAALALAVEHL